MAVKVNSLGSYSTMPRSRKVETLVTLTSDRRDLVPAPMARSRGQERTTSTSAGTEAGANEALIRGKGGPLFQADANHAVAGLVLRLRGTSCQGWRCRAGRIRLATFGGSRFP